MAPRKFTHLFQFAMVISILSFIFFTGCNQEGRGFALPKGDMEAGKIAFINMSCNECHSTSDVEWRGSDENIQVPLGGEVGVVKSYGELVTSIINPNHKLAKVYRKKAESGETSPMSNYNDLMTVKELVDVVTYLQNEYDIITPPAYYYPF